ncbi:MAG: ABC transporter permease [Nitrososphaerota archaeon]|nr:ABC transporter permease [Nitrososphaerota archaeon]
MDFAWRDLRGRYKGSALGFAWHFVMPLTQLLVFWVLFGVLFGVRPRVASGEEVNYAVFLFVGLVPWTFFSTSPSVPEPTLVRYSSAARAAAIRRGYTRRFTSKGTFTLEEKRPYRLEASAGREPVA